MSAAFISPARLAELCKAAPNIDLIDVRTPAEFNELHVQFARNVPLDQLDPAALIQTQRDPTSPLYFICRTGSRARQACEKLKKAGFSNAINIEGGTVACDQVGLAMVRGKKTIALERQVRIAAGSLVLLGVVLAWFVHPAFTALSAFVGAGLIFSGVTDTCGMGLLLARMPWNRNASESIGSGSCKNPAASG